MLDTMRVRFLVTTAFLLALVFPCCQVEARAQASPGDTTGGWVGQRIIMLQGKYAPDL